MLIVVLLVSLLITGFALNDYKNKSINYALRFAKRIIVQIQNPELENYWPEGTHSFDKVELIKMNIDTMYFIVTKGEDEIYVQVKNWRYPEMGIQLKIRFFDNEKGANVYT